MREWLVKKFWLLFLCFALFCSLFLCPDGILDYINVKLELKARDRSIENLKKENTALTRTLERLRNDEEALLEEYARRHGLLKDGERLCILVEK